MKNFILFLVCFLFFVSCEKEKTSNLNLIKENFKTDNLTTNEFVLKRDTVLKGKFGTKVFIPNDLFENYTGRKIKFEIKEYYSKEDMILNGLSTITDKNELLESSGMLYINFTEEGNQLKIKNGKKYKVQLPNKILEKSNIYSNDNDSIFKWKLESEKLRTQIPDINMNYFYFNNALDGDRFGGFFKEVSIDSVNLIKKNDSIKLIETLKKEETEYFNNNSSTMLKLGYELKNGRIILNGEKIENEPIFKTENEIYSFISNKLNWINIDKILKIEIEKKIKFRLNKKFDKYCVNIIYLDFKSVLNEYVNSDFNLLNIKIKGKMKVVIYTNNNDKIYYDTIYIDKNSKSDFDVKLKETSLSKLKEFLVSP